MGPSATLTPTTTSRTTATIGSGFVLGDVATATTPATAPHAIGTHITLYRASGTKSIPHTAPRRAPRLCVASRPATHTHTRPREYHHLSLSPSATRRDIARMRPAALEYVTVLARRQRFWSGMANGDVRRVMPVKPARASKAPTEARTTAATCLCFDVRGRTAAKAAPNPTADAPKGKNESGRPVAAARTNHQAPSAMEEASTAVVARSTRPRPATKRRRTSEPAPMTSALCSQKPPLVSALTTISPAAHAGAAHTREVRGRAASTSAWRGSSPLGAAITSPAVPSQPV